MMRQSDNMFWGDIGDITRFSENTTSNKNKSARKTSAIILAAVQLMENYIKGIKHMDAYTASSTILSSANWIKKSSVDRYKDEKGNEIIIKPGTVYYIDYGNSFYGELAYYHHGLCVGKIDGKVLVIPMTSGKEFFSSCYHPINNPKSNKKFRQALLSEGFEKDCVLKMNDAKFISPGRIERETTTIRNDILLEIQKQLFSIEFPYFYQKFCNNINENKKLTKQINDQKELINKLKQEKNTLTQKLKNIENRNSQNKRSC